MMLLLLSLFACDGCHGVHGHFGAGTAAHAAALPSGTPFSVTEVAKVDGPTGLAEPAAGPAGLVVLEQAGRMLRIGESGATSVILDITDRVQSGGETGLLGVAFHPKWPDDPRCFVNYTYKEGGRLRTRVASFRSADGGRTLDPSSELEVLSFVQPYSNHNSGSLDFGPDGMLYAAIGDGGSAGDPNGTGQDRSDLLASILRLDIDTPPYAVPADNPFVGQPGVRAEVWAYGVRNPWGMHFDGAQLWWADVGQNEWEEVDKGVAGGNYGWNRKEGERCYEIATCAGDYVEPAAAYSHSAGSCVTGGFVYRGPSIPAIDGKYVYGDFVTGRFWALPPAGGAPERLVESQIHPSTFGRGRDGSMYVTDFSSGTVLRLGPPVAR
jgi:glucose/arabinose dehydrogenase